MFHVRTERVPFFFFFYSLQSRSDLQWRTSASALTPHLYALDVQASSCSFAPGGIPLFGCVPKLLLGGWGEVTPGFVGYLITVEMRHVRNGLIDLFQQTVAVRHQERKRKYVREISIRGAYCHVQDEVVWLIEGCCWISSLTPGVVQCRVVHNLLAESTSLPHILVVLGPGDEENLLFTMPVSVCVQV